MKKNNLTITISGERASGKSHLLFLLKNYLRDNNFNVEYELNADYPTEILFDNQINRKFDNVIEIIKERSNIILKEIVTQEK